MKCKLCHKDMRCIIKHGHDYFVGGNEEADFSIHYCDACKIGYTYPELDDEALSQYYPETYEAYVSKKSVLNALQIYKYGSDLSIIEKNMQKRPDRVYEIGSGRGQFLATLKKKWKDISVLEGCEQSETGVGNALREYGIELECKKADDIVFSQKYDLIVLRHVLEHLNNFDTVIKNIHENGLEESGLLFLKVPKLNSYETKKFGKFSADLDMPRHRVHFTDAGMRKFLTDNGFKNIKIYNEAVPSSYDRSMQYRKMGRVYLSDKTKVFRYIWIELKLLVHKKNAGRMIVTAEK